MSVLLLAAVSAPARDSLFGRRATAEEKAAAQEPAAPQPKPVNPAKPAEPSKEADGAKSAEVPKESPPAEKDEGVIIRPVKLNAGIEIKERKDFSLSRIGKPIAQETASDFLAAWTMFRAQNRLVDDGSGGKTFKRIPQPVFPGSPVSEAPGAAGAAVDAGVTGFRLWLQQDLGEGRWLARAQWCNRGLGDWCPPGDNSDTVIVVLPEGEGKVPGYEALTGLGLVHVGLVDARFDCKVPPAEGRRITTRRHAFIAQPTLPDDEATRALFQQVVAAGRHPVEVVVVQRRDCKTCGGIGYLRRAVPGRIQDERDPCTGGCAGGDKWVPVLLTFKP